MVISYKKSGVDYSSLDYVKRLAQVAAFTTRTNLNNGNSEYSETRGESAYVWKSGEKLFASVIEGLGTKNQIADELRSITGKTYYDVMGHDTVASIINDLVSVGARPIVVNAYWAVGDAAWFEDAQRVKDLVRGWKKACNLAGASWGGGETPALSKTIIKSTIDLAGSAVGILKKEKHLITQKKLKAGDIIIFLKSNGVNANGLSLARAVGLSLPQKYGTKINDKTYGEMLLTKVNIYANLIADLQDNEIDIHYVSNITGHGIRKIMRANIDFTYVIEKLFEPQKVFKFIKEKASLDDYEMYQTFNMGQDYAIFVSEKDAKKTLKIIKKNGFQGLEAGIVEKGKRQVILKEKNILYDSKTLNLR